MAKSEDSFVRWVAAQCRVRRGDLAIGIGDDMAMFGHARDGWLITADLLMDGVDFDSLVHSPERIGRKALAVSLSDCAAMAVQPRFALVSVALPESWTMRQAQRLFLGVRNLAQESGCTLIGGDTNSWDRPLVIDVIILGRPWPQVRPVRRDGLRPGDAVCVTGRLGGSLLRHHLDFTPRVREARALARKMGRDLHAMMDLSDGLSTDAPRMARASGCGIEFDSAAIEATVSSDARKAMKRDGRSALDHALNDGEDFELLFAALPKSLAGLRLPCSWQRIGTAVPGRGVWIRPASGKRERLPARGWMHWTAMPR
jgi:thiamine-monophosphate kinase